MTEPSKLSELFDGVSTVNLSEETKSSCQRVSDYFGKLIHKDGENVFSAMASGEARSLSRVLKMSIPGEDVCEKIEQIRKSLFDGEPTERTAALYFETVNRTFQYVDILEITKEINVEDAVEATLAFYETYGRRSFTVDEQLYRDVKRGVAAAFKPFFEEYLAKYRAQMKDVMLACSFGAERNYEASYRKTTYQYIELLLCYALTYAYRCELFSDSFVRFTKRLTEDTVRDAEAFYQLWLTVNNEVMEEAFAGETFSDLLFATVNVYHELLAASKKLYETNLGNAPVAKESDMRELYQTVYELRKELDAVKKELAEVKGC